MLVVLAAAGLFVYLQLRANLDEGIDASLRSRADDAVALVERSGARLPGPRAGSLAEPEEAFLQLLTPAGDLVAVTGGARGPALSAAEVRRAAGKPMLLERRVAGVDGTARMLVHSTSAERRRFVVVAGSSLEDRDDTLAGVIASFALGGPLAVLIASGLGYLLARAGLAPVEAMRVRAEGVSLTRAGERLPLPPARDEIRRLGETLNEMLSRLGASFERERRFVADASHELRTPLAVVKTELEAALRTGGEVPTQRESLLAALEETDHLALLAEDLLLIARAGEGRLPVRAEIVDVRALLDQARERFVDRARPHGREITVRAPALQARLDPLRLRQALGNLVDNALRHGAGDIELAAQETGEDLLIEVTDAGEGFGPELADRAFERFARGDAARSGGGAGLGLAIVRAIAEAHGGGATIEAGARGRATVRLRFPAAGEHAQTDASSPSRHAD